MTEAPRLLGEEEEAWRILCERFEQIPEDRFEEPSLSPEGWSPKDAMFHVAAWMDDCGLQLERMRDGSLDPTQETREMVERQNQAWFELSRTMDPTDVRSRFATSRRRMVEAFRALGRAFDERTPEAIEWFEESGALHYVKHDEDLRVFIEAPRA